jgi:hypothetical protein
MSGSQRRQQIPSERNDVFGWEGAGDQATLQRLSLHVVHDVIQQPVGFSGEVNGNDVGMIESCQILGFADKPLHCHGGRELRAKRLDGHRPVQGDVPAEKDRPHASAGELALDREVGRESIPQPLQYRRHRDRLTSIVSGTQGR